MKHRIIILASFALLVISALLFNNLNFFPEPVLAMLGILVVLSGLVSPVTVIYSVVELKYIGVNKVTISFVVLSIAYLFLVFCGIYRVWPQLMSV